MKPILACALIAAVITAASSQAAILVGIDSITYTGSAPAQGGLNLDNPSNLINGSGLSEPLTAANIDSVIHAAVAFGNGGNAWATTDPGGPGSDFFASTSETVSFELIFDGTYELTNFYNWSYGFGSANGNNIRSVTFDFGVGNFDSSTGNITLTAITPASTLSNTPINLTADRVRINVVDNYFGVAGFDGGDRVGAAEFAFLAVPEPSSALLAGFGLLALLRRRRAA